MAYHSVSPELSLGSGMLRVFHGTRPIAPAAQLPSSKPSLFMSGQGRSPGRALGPPRGGVRDADHPINASLTLASSISTFLDFWSAIELETNVVELKKMAPKPTMTRSAARISACPR